MSQEENKDEKNRKKQIELVKTALAFIAVLGVVPLVAVVPGVMKAIAPFVRQKRRYRTPTYVAGMVGRLQKRGLITTYREGGILIAKLTEKGERELLKHKLKESGQKKQRWDGKWRVVIFDICETKRGRRDQIRKSIFRFGFLRLQDSVWVYPYQCEELVALLKAECHLGGELLYMTVERVEDDARLRKSFGLP